MANYIIITDHTGDNVMRYDADDMAEIYTPAEINALKAGNVITKGTSLHADMVAIARNAMHDELVNA